MLMGPHDGAVYKDVLKVRIFGHCIKKTIKHTVTAPSVESDINRVPLAEVIRQCPPMSACSCQPKYAFHELSIVLAGSARITLLTGKMVLHLLPNAVAQFLSAQSCWPPIQYPA